MCAKLGQHYLCILADVCVLNFHTVWTYFCIYYYLAAVRAAVLALFHLIHVFKKYLIYLEYKKHMAKCIIKALSVGGGKRL